MWSTLRDLFLKKKGTGRKRVSKRFLLEKKPGRCYLNWVSKFSNTCSKSHWSMHPLMWCKMKALHLCGLLQTLYSITNSCNLLKLRSIESVMLTTISSYVIPFSSCLQSFPASGSFQMSYFFETGGQSIGVPFLVISPSSEYSGLISFKMEWLDLLAVQGLSRVFSNTIVQMHPFFGTQVSL